MSNKFGENTSVMWSDRKRIMGMPITFTKYSLVTNNEDWTKLFIKTGFLSTAMDEINLFRIYDVQIHQSLFQKMFGVGTITLFSKDVTSPVTEIINVKNPYKVRNLLAEKIEESRDQKGVHIGEFY